MSGSEIAAVRVVCLHTESSFQLSNYKTIIDFCASVSSYILSLILFVGCFTRFGCCFWETA